MVCKVVLAFSDAAYTNTNYFGVPNLIDSGVVYCEQTKIVTMSIVNKLSETSAITSDKYYYSLVNVELVCNTLSPLASIFPSTIGYYRINISME